MALNGRLSAALALVASPWLFGCEESPRVLAAADAGARVKPPPPPSSPPKEEGCTRAGSLEGIESDPACVLTRIPEDAMRDLDKRVSIRLELDPDTVVAGSTALLRLTLTNVSGSDVLVLFDAYPRALGPRPDWSRLAGVPDVKGDPSDVPRIQIVTTTLDSRERPVDAVPVVESSALGAPEPRVLGVRLRPRAKLKHVISWWALRIPAPAPIVKDDAGHRYVPKTTAVPLYAGEYVVSVELPLHGVSPAERTFKVRAHVERAPKKAKKPHP